MFKMDPSREGRKRKQQATTTTPISKKGYNSLLCISRCTLSLPIFVFLMVATAVVAQKEIASASSATTTISNPDYRFAIMAKSINNTFFDPVREGAQAQAVLYHDMDGLNIEIDWVGGVVEDPTGLAQREWIQEIIDLTVNGTRMYHGLAISVMNGPAIEEVISQALDVGMSVICFDSDASEASQRQAYVGTDNVAFGEQLGKVLLQLRPQGGQYAILTIPGTNLEQRVQGIRQGLARSTWQELPNSLTYQEGTVQDAIKQIQQLKQQNPSLGAIFPSYGALMNDAETWTDFVDEHRDMAFVVADAMPRQIALMGRGYADGLVGQLPYQSGQQIVDTLLSLQREGNPPRDRNKDKKFGTELTLFLRVPLILPELNLNPNFIGDLRILGFALFTLLIIFSAALAGWMFQKRKTRIVQAAQPLFLVFILFGVFLMALSIFPLSMDDERYSQNAVNFACNATPWCLSIGFTLIFSALFAKLWRIHKLIDSASRFNKQKVTIRDVMLPFLSLSVANLGILITWSILDPLQYERLDHPGRDPWNRVISTYGTCVSSSGDSPRAFAIPLTIVNLGALIMSNYWAFQCRNIQSELSESKYVALCVMSMTQAVVVGLPVLLLVSDDTRANYVVRVLLVFMISSAILGFIFLPKIFYHHANISRRHTSSAMKVSFAHASGGDGSRQWGSNFLNQGLPYSNFELESQEETSQCPGAMKSVNFSPATCDDYWQTNPNPNDPTAEPHDFNVITVTSLRAKASLAESSLANSTITTNASPRMADIDSTTFRRGSGRDDGKTGPRKTDVEEELGEERRRDERQE